MVICAAEHMALPLSSLIWGVEEYGLGAAEEGRASLGSFAHEGGNCRPCAFFWKSVGCLQGQDCTFCHVCDSGAMKARKKAKWLGVAEQPPCMADFSGLYDMAVCQVPPPPPILPPEIWALVGSPEFAPPPPSTEPSLEEAFYFRACKGDRAVGWDYLDSASLASTQSPSASSYASELSPTAVPWFPASFFQQPPSPPNPPSGDLLAATPRKVKLAGGATLWRLPPPRRASDGDAPAEGARAASRVVVVSEFGMLRAFELEPRADESLISEGSGVSCLATLRMGACGSAARRCQSCPAALLRPLCFADEEEESRPPSPRLTASPATAGAVHLADATAAANEREEAPAPATPIPDSPTRTTLRILQRVQAVASRGTVDSPPSAGAGNTAGDWAAPPTPPPPPSRRLAAAAPAAAAASSPTTPTAAAAASSPRSTSTATPPTAPSQRSRAAGRMEWRPKLNPPSTWQEDEATDSQSAGAPEKTSRPAAVRRMGRAGPRTPVGQPTPACGGSTSRRAGW